MRSADCFLLVALTATTGLAAEPGSIFGNVQDWSGRILADTRIQVQSESTGARWNTHADDRGQYSVGDLPPGPYKVTVRWPGFRTAARTGEIVDSGRGLQLDFTLELLSLHETMTVVSGHDDVDPSSSDSLRLARGNPGATLPSNGGDYRMLFDLMPGIIVTPAGVSDAGQFASNGQRPNSNAFRVDGVSANTGVGASALPGSLQRGPARTPSMEIS